MIKKKIVIVDDTAINLKIGLNALKDFYEVSTVLSGEKLFSLLEKTTPDLILLDIEMPEINGFEVFESLRANPKTCNIPVIYLTSSNSLDHEERSFAMGAADFIHKPYYAPFLRKRIDMHLKYLEYEQNLQNSKKALDELQMRFMKTMVELAGRRNEVSGGNLERTRKYMEVLLDVLIKNGIYSDIVTSWEKDLLLNSTMFYDLGKICIHDSILQKPDKLEACEFSTVKKHTFMGVKLIDEIRTQLADNSMETHMLDYAKDFAAYHHEKWDGTGYPSGLKGYNIPLPGRLMAITDVYDALTSKRTYKKAYTHEEAAGIISQGKGSHFDPVLVDAFISVADQFRNIAGNESL